MTFAEKMKKLEQYDTPSITNVVATYPQDKEHCLGLYDPWNEEWYTDETAHCIFPELGRRAGCAVTVTYGLPDTGLDRLGFYDLLKAIEDAPKPVVLILKQDMPEALKKKCGLLGGNMMTAFKSVGVVGVISDGPSRDVDEVRPLGLQYMLTGVCPGHGDFSIHAVNTPVSVCGMKVTPGEIVHMDENGAVKFPAQALDRVLELCEGLAEYETEKQRLLSRYHDAETLARIMADQYQ